MKAKVVQMNVPEMRTYINPEQENEPKRGVLMVDFINQITSRRGKSEEYRKMYGLAAKFITEFSEETKSVIMTNSISEEFLEDLVSWLEERGLRPNSIKSVVGRIKAMCRKAANYGYSVNRTFDDFSYEGEDAPGIALSMNEVTRIYYFRGLTKKQEEIKDLFVLGCMTGLRYSDYSKLKPENIQDGLIVKKTKKTGALVHVPIHPYVSEILTKYGGFPKGHTIQYFNRAIKQICKTIGLDDIVTTPRMVKGEAVMESHPKWELVGSHTARRSFATNAYFSGKLTAVQVMAITGHTTEKCFLKYIKFSKIDNARAIATDQFFRT